jgi:hypothetical protein
MPHRADHDPQFCAACQFGLTFSRVCGALAGVLIFLVILGGLGISGFFAFFYFSSHPDKLGTTAIVAFSFLLIAVCWGVASAVKDRLSQWLSDRRWARRTSLKRVGEQPTDDES